MDSIFNKFQIDKGLDFKYIEDDYDTADFFLSLNGILTDTISHPWESIYPAKRLNSVHHTPVSCNHHAVARADFYLSLSRMIARLQ